MEKKSISVVIPVYNSQMTIIDVLNKISDQTKKELIREIVIVNDGSTDKTEDVIINYINNNQSEIQIKYLKQKNLGVSAARNNGMNVSSGKWIAFCDADDLWEPYKLEHQEKIVDNIPDLDFLSGQVTKNIKENELKILKPNKLQFLIKSYVATSTVLMKKKIFDEIGGFEIGNNYSEDMKYFFKIQLKYNIYIDWKYICNYGFGKASFGESGLSQDLTKMFRGTLDILAEAKENKDINKIEWSLLYILYYIKHYRRVILTTLRNKEEKK